MASPPARLGTWIVFRLIETVCWADLLGAAIRLLLLGCQEVVGNPVSAFTSANVSASRFQF